MATQLAMENTEIFRDKNMLLASYALKWLKSSFPISRINRSIADFVFHLCKITGTICISLHFSSTLDASKRNNFRNARDICVQGPFCTIFTSQTHIRRRVIQTYLFAQSRHLISSLTSFYNLMTKIMLIPLKFLQTMPNKWPCEVARSAKCINLI